MRLGFLWGIVTGAVVMTALGWIVSAWNDPPAPGQSVVVRQPAGNVIAVEPPEDPQQATEASGSPADATRSGAEEDIAVREMPEGVSSGGALDSNSENPAATQAAPDESAPAAAAARSEAPSADGNGASDAASGAGEPDRLAAVAPRAAAGSGSTGPVADGGKTGGADADTADPLAPQFDLVRVDASGQTVIAGHATPGQHVEILLDGEVVETVSADASGNFVAVIAAELGDTARQLQLRVTVPDTAADTDISGAVGGGTPPGSGEIAPEPTRPGTDMADHGSRPVSEDTLALNERAPSTPAPPEEPAAAAQPRPGVPLAVSGPEPSAVRAPEMAAAARPEGGETAGEAPSIDRLRDEGEEAGDPARQPAQAVAGTPVPSEGATEAPARDTAEDDATGRAESAPAAAPRIVIDAPRATGADAPGEAVAASDGLPTPREAPPGASDISETSTDALVASVAETPAGAPPAGTDAPEPGQRYVLSAPVLILPSQEGDGAPALVRPGGEELALLQPAGEAPDRPADGVILDQITYDPDGDLVMRGRGDERHAMRIYGDGRLLDTVPVRDGGWRLSLPRDRVEKLSLFRFDEIGPTGQVTSRIEVPFRYTGERPQVLRDREVVIQRGDNLWRIAEQFYGEGLRYSVIYGANSELIRDPDLIYPDQVFTIPELVEGD